MKPLSSNEACRILGVHVTTLWNWDDKGLVKSTRTENGYRWYNPDDIARLSIDPPNLKKGVHQYDIVGKRFGKLTVLQRSKDRNTRQSWWLCRCDCGEQAEIRGIKLVRGDTKSCGCLRGSTPAYNFSGCGDLSGKYWSQIKRHAKSRGLEFSITMKEAWDLLEKQNGKCALSKLDIVLNRKGKGQTASLDRIDSNKGYFLDNVQWVHKTVNKMKMNLPENRFIFICKQIALSN